jgi:hypothetical protein
MQERCGMNNTIVEVFIKGQPYFAFCFNINEIHNKNLYAQLSRLMSSRYTTEDLGLVSEDGLRNVFAKLRDANAWAVSFIVLGEELWILSQLDLDAFVYAANRDLPLMSQLTMPGWHVNVRFLNGQKNDLKYPQFIAGIQNS